MRLKDLERQIGELEAEGGRGPETGGLRKQVEEIRAMQRESRALVKKIREQKARPRDVLALPETKAFVEAELSELRPLMEAGKKALKRIKALNRGLEEARRHPRKLPGVVLLIQEILGRARKVSSAQSVWNKAKSLLPKKIDCYDLSIEGKTLSHRDTSGNEKARKITFRTFERYVHEVKNNLKK